MTNFENSVGYLLNHRRSMDVQVEVEGCVGRDRGGRGMAQCESGGVGV